MTMISPPTDPSAVSDEHPEDVGQQLTENRFNAKLNITSLQDSPFTSNGRREFLSYRDLGVAEATNGHVGAAISRSSGPVLDVKTGWHYHECDLQVFYIIRGWVDIEFEETGKIRLEQGTCVTIPPGVVHNELDISQDNEILEIVLPSKIGTVTIDERYSGGNSADMGVRAERS